MTSENFEDLETRVDNLGVELERVIQSCENGLRELTGEADVLAEAKLAVQSKIQAAVDDQVQGLTSLIAEVERALASSHQDLGEVIDQLRETSDIHIEDLADVQGDVTQALTEVSTSLRETIAQVAALNEALSSKSGEVLEEFVNTPATEVTAEISERMQDLADNLVEKIAEIVVSATETAEEEVRRQLEDLATPAIESIQDAIDSVFEQARKSILDDSDDASTKREAMDAAIEQLQPAFAALQGALEAVRSTARSVGISV